MPKLYLTGISFQKLQILRKNSANPPAVRARYMPCWWYEHWLAESLVRLQIHASACARTGGSAVIGGSPPGHGDARGCGSRPGYSHAQWCAGAVLARARGHSPAVSPERLLESQRKQIDALRQVSSFSRADFDAYIRPLIACYAAFVHLLPASDSG